MLQSDSSARLSRCMPHQERGAFVKPTPIIMSSLAAFAALIGAAAAQAPVTVQALLGQDFAVVGTITSPVGPGLFLQKKADLYLCFVSETAQSTTVATRYCKKVQ